MKNAHNFLRVSLPAYEQFIEPSATVPDMSLSLRDLLNRHNNGSKVKTYEAVYSDKHIGLERMDKIERQAMANELSDFVKTSRGKIISARQFREKEESDRLVIEQYEKKRKTRSDIVDAEVADL